MTAIFLDNILFWIPLLTHVLLVCILVHQYTIQWSIIGGYYQEYTLAIINNMLIVITQMYIQDVAIYSFVAVMFLRFCLIVLTDGQTATKKTVSRKLKERRGTR